MKGVGHALTKPVVSLVGMEENVYSLIGRVSRILDEQGLHDLTDKFVGEIVTVEDYGEAVRRSQSFVEFEEQETNESATAR